MKRLSLSLLFVIVTVLLRGQIFFETIIGNAGCYEEAFSAVATTDGYAVSASYNCNFGPGNSEGALIFLNENGYPAGRTDNLPANGWMQQDDNHFIFAGGNKATLYYDTIAIVKTNANGNTLWTKKYKPGICNHVIYGLTITNNGFLCCGFYSTDSCNNATYDAFALKLDKDGNEQWFTAIKGNNNQQFYAIKELTDQSIAAFGWTDNTTDGMGKFFMVKFSATGDSLSSFIVDEPGNFRGYDMDITDDGHFIFSGIKDNHAVIYKTDHEGKIIWSKTTGHHCGSSYYKALFTADKQYLFTRLITSDIGCHTSVIKTDTAGNILWERVFPAVIRHVNEPRKGSFLLSGFRLRPDNFISEIYVARFDTTHADSSTLITEQLMISGSAKVFPNPTDGYVYIETDYFNSSLPDVLFYDMSGRIIAREKMNTTKCKILLQPVCSPVVIYNIIYPEKIISGKIIAGHLH